MKSIKENETGEQNLGGSTSNIKENVGMKKILERINNLSPWVVVTLIALIFLVLFC